MASNPSSFPPAASSGGPPGATGTQLNQLGNQFFQFLHAQQASPADPNASTSPASATNSSASPQASPASSYAEMFKAFQQWAQSGTGPANPAAAQPYPSAPPPPAHHAASTVNFANLRAGSSALAIQNQRRALQNNGADHNQGKGGKGGFPNQPICPGCGGPHGWQSCPNLAQHEDAVFSHIIVTEQAKYERDQNRARINAKIMAAGLDPMAFNFNRSNNGPGYGAPVNVMAQLSGGSTSTPNYGAAFPFPNSGPSPPAGTASMGQTHSPSPNTAEMFQRFQEFMNQAAHDTCAGTSQGNAAQGQPGTGDGNRQRRHINVDITEFEDVLDTPLPPRDKRKRCDRTPGNDDTRSPAPKRGEPGDDDDVLRALFSDPPDAAPAAQDTQNEIAQLQRQAVEAKRRLAELRGARPAARPVTEHIPGMLDIQARRCLTHALRTPKENDTVFVVSYSPDESKYSYKKGVVQQVDREFVYILPADVPEDAMEDAAPSVHERHWLFRDETKAAAAMSALNDLLRVN